MNSLKPQFWELEKYTDLLDTPAAILNNRNVVSGAGKLDWNELFDRRFTSLNDTPTNYTGQAGKNVAVRADGAGLEFITPPAAFNKRFTGLIDTPTNYTGQAGKNVAVRADGLGLEFVSPPEIPAAERIKSRITSALPQTTLGYTVSGQGSRANRGGTFNMTANAGQSYWWRMHEGFPIRTLKPGDKIRGNCLIHWRDTDRIDVHSRWVDGTTIMDFNYNGISILVQNKNLFIRLADGTTNTRYLMESNVGTRINVKWEYEHTVGVRAWIDDVFQGTYVHGTNDFLGNRWYRHIVGVRSYDAAAAKSANFGHEWLEF